MSRPCLRPGCVRPHLALGYCSLHYGRLRRGADLGGNERRGNAYAPGVVCKEDGCEARPRARGLCEVHYARWHHRHYQDKTCKHPDGCQRPHEAAGWCALHHSRVKRSGDPGPLEPRTPRRPLPTGAYAEWTRAEQQRFYLYGLTPADVAQMLAAQGGRCYVCRSTDPAGQNWCVDHCHQTGKVRFIACNRCNMALGLIKEDPEIARRLLEVAIECRQRLAAEGVTTNGLPKHEGVGIDLLGRTQG